MKRAVAAPGAAMLAPIAMIAISSSAAACDGRRRQEPEPRISPASPASPAAASTVAPALDCQSVMLHVRGVLTVELARIPGALGPLERGLTIAAASCRRDEWPEPLRACLRGVPAIGSAGGSAGLWRCAELAPVPLRERLEKELREAL